LAGVDVVVVGAFLGGSPNGGDTAPDGDGVFFGAGIPAINASGEVVFPCSFTTGSGGTGIARGTTAPGSRRLVVRQGDPAPDGNGNFSTFDLAAVGINDAGQVAFAARLVDTFGPDDTTGILRGDVGPDHLIFLARSGQTVDTIKLAELAGTPPALSASG